MDGIKRCLVLSPHYDDAELGCGATMSKLRRMGVAVEVLVFAAQRRLDGSRYENLMNEMNASMAILDVQPVIESLESRHLQERRQTVLDILYREFETFNPDLVIGPTLTDAHQDHEVVAAEAFRAFKFRSLLGYDFPWNVRRESTLSTFVKVTEEDLDKKVRALDCYVSQKPRSYLKRDSIFSIARLRGLQCGVEYAEAFETYRRLC